jgi:hypothetical protein
MGCIIRMNGSWSHGCALDMRTKRRLRMDAFREPHRWMATLQSVVEAAWLLHARIVANHLVICRNGCGGRRIRLVALICRQHILRTIDWQVRARLRDRIIIPRELPRSDVNLGEEQWKCTPMRILSLACDNPDVDLIRNHCLASLAVDLVIQTL